MMAISDEKRHAVRKQYNFACGYCGISEIDAGCELEIDHFQPIKYGGTDEQDNLVYACTACNRNKASYWPSLNSYRFNIKLNLVGRFELGYASLTQPTTSTH